MSGAPPSPPGYTSRDALVKDDRAWRFLSGEPTVDISSSAQSVPRITETEAAENVRWAQERVDDVEAMLAYEENPTRQKRLEDAVERAHERLEKARREYARVVAATSKGSAGLKPTESLTSATLGKAMGKGRKTKRTTRKKRRSKKWTSSGTRRRH